MENLMGLAIVVAVLAVCQNQSVQTLMLMGKRVPAMQSLYSIIIPIVAFVLAIVSVAT